MSTPPPGGARKKDMGREEEEEGIEEVHRTPRSGRKDRKANAPMGRSIVKDAQGNLIEQDPQLRGELMAERHIRTASAEPKFETVLLNLSNALLNTQMNVLKNSQKLKNEPEAMVDYIKQAVDTREMIKDHQKQSHACEVHPSITKEPRYGTSTDLGSKVIPKVLEWNGSPPSQAKCKEWLNKILGAAGAAKLTEQATKELLILKSKGTLWVSISEWEETGKPMSEIISRIETQFGQILDPQEAAQQLSYIQKKTGEEPVEYAARVRLLAEMSSRMEPNREIRRDMINEIIGQKLRNSMPNDISDLVRMAEENDRRTGKAVWNVDTLLDKITKETNRISQRDKRQDPEKVEKDKDEEKKEKPMDQNEFLKQVKEIVQQSMEERLSEYQSPIEAAQGQAYQVTGVPPPALYNTPGYPYQNGMNRPLRPWITGGAKQQPAWRGGFRGGQRSRYPRNPNYLAPGIAAQEEISRLYEMIGQVSMGAEGGFQEQSAMEALSCLSPEEAAYHLKDFTSIRQAGEIAINWQESEHMGDYAGIPKLANVAATECAKCGQSSPSHRYSSINCPLYGEPMKDRPCAGCGKGLHTMDKCLKSKMSDHMHPADIRASKN